jgi:hypothetical protein
MQPSQNLRLPAVVILVVVLLAKQNNLGCGGSRQHLFAGNALQDRSGRLPPATRGGTGGGRCRRAKRGRRSDQYRDSGKQRAQEQPWRTRKIHVVQSSRSGDRAMITAMTTIF